MSDKVLRPTEITAGNNADDRTRLSDIYQDQDVFSFIPETLPFQTDLSFSKAEDYAGKSLFAEPMLEPAMVSYQTVAGSTIKGITGGIINGALGLVEGVGYLVDVPDWFSDEDSNWLSDLAISGQEGISEDLMPIYRRNPHMMFDPGQFGSYARAFRDISASVLQFLIPGMGITRLATGLLKGAKWLQSAGKVGKALASAEGAGLAGRATAALSTNYMETMVMATRLRDQVRDELAPKVEQGLITQQEANEIAQTATNNLKLLNRVMVIQDLFALRGIFKTTDALKDRLAKEYLQESMRPTRAKILGEFAKDSFTEAGEEALQGVFSKESIYQAKLGTAVKDIESPQNAFERYVDYLTDSETLLEAAMGFFGGAMVQSATNLARPSLKKQQEAFDDIYKKQQDFRKKLQNILTEIASFKAQAVENVDEITVAKTNFASVYFDALYDGREHIIDMELEELMESENFEHKDMVESFLDMRDDIVDTYKRIRNQFDPQNVAFKLGMKEPIPNAIGRKQQRKVFMDKLLSDMFRNHFQENYNPSDYVGETAKNSIEKWESQYRKVKEAQHYKEVIVPLLKELEQEANEELQLLNEELDNNIENIKQKYQLQRDSNKELVSTPKVVKAKKDALAKKEKQDYENLKTKYEIKRKRLERKYEKQAKKIEENNKLKLEPGLITLDNLFEETNDKDLNNAKSNVSYEIAKENKDFNRLVNSFNIAKRYKEKYDKKTSNDGLRKLIKKSKKDAEKASIKNARQEEAAKGNKTENDTKPPKKKKKKDKKEKKKDEEEKVQDQEDPKTEPQTREETAEEDFEEVDDDLESAEGSEEQPEEEEEFNIIIGEEKPQKKKVNPISTFGKYVDEKSKKDGPIRAAEIRKGKADKHIDEQIESLRLIGEALTYVLEEKGINLDESNESFEQLVKKHIPFKEFVTMVYNESGGSETSYKGQFQYIGTYYNLITKAKDPSILPITYSDWVKGLNAERIRNAERYVDEKAQNKIHDINLNFENNKDDFIEDDQPSKSANAPYEFGWLAKKYKEEDRSGKIVKKERSNTINDEYIRLLEPGHVVEGDEVVMIPLPNFEGKVNNFERKKDGRTSGLKKENWLDVKKRNNLKRNDQSYIDSVPIGIYKLIDGKYELLAFVHDVNFINYENTSESEESMFQQRNILRSLREEILNNAEEGYATSSTVESISSGHVIYDANNEIDTVSNRFDFTGDFAPKLAIATSKAGKEQLTGTDGKVIRDTDLDPDHRKKNRKYSLFNGATYILLPAKQRNNKTFYVPHPVKNKPLNRNQVNHVISILRANLYTRINNDLREELEANGIKISQNAKSLRAQLDPFFNVLMLAEDNYKTGLDGLVAQQMGNENDGFVTPTVAIVHNKDGNITSVDIGYRGHVTRLKPTTSNKSLTEPFKKVRIALLSKRLVPSKKRFKDDTTSPKPITLISFNGSRITELETYESYFDMITNSLTTKLTPINTGTEATPKYIYTIQKTFRFSKNTKIKSISSSSLPQNVNVDQLIKDRGDSESTSSVDFDNIQMLITALRSLGIKNNVKYGLLKTSLNFYFPDVDFSQFQNNVELLKKLHYVFSSMETEVLSFANIKSNQQYLDTMDEVMSIFSSLLYANVGASTDQDFLEFYKIFDENIKGFEMYLNDVLSNREQGSLLLEIFSDDARIELKDKMLEKLGIIAVPNEFQEIFIEFNELLKDFSFNTVTSVNKFVVGLSDRLDMIDGKLKGDELQKIQKFMLDFSKLKKLDVTERPITDFVEFIKIDENKEEISGVEPNPNPQQEDDWSIDLASDLGIEDDNSYKREDDPDRGVEIRKQIDKNNKNNCI